jgi:hypothetical protein
MRTEQRESFMGLVVSAQVIRELIADGEYLVECIEHREHGKAAVAFTLRSRVQPYGLQIETTDNKLGGLFRALLNEEPSRTGKPAMTKVGGQPVPIVEVDTLPVDASRGRKRRKQGANDADIPKPGAPREPTARRGSTERPFALVAQEPPRKPAPVLNASKRRRTARAGERNETP